MESTSEPMKIQISEATQSLLDDDKPQQHRRSSITVHCKRPKFITKLREKVINDRFRYKDKRNISMEQFLDSIK